MPSDPCKSDELSPTIETVQVYPNLTKNFNETEERAILTSSCKPGYRKDSRNQCRKVISAKCLKRN